MGNPRKRGHKQEHFAQLIRTMMEEPAWRALPSTAQALYPWLKLEWHGLDYNNNGKIQLSVRQAANCLGIGLRRASRAFHGLQAKGFLVVTKHAQLGLDGHGQSPMFEITELKMPNTNDQAGRKLYKSWRPGQDFPVHKTMTNNPSGRNGKTKSRFKKGEVIDFSKLLKNVPAN